MPGKSKSVPVVRRKVKRHPVPDYYRGITTKRHDWPSTYGNGWNGSNKPANQPSKSQ
jgi:hypothetical protein